MVYLIHLEEPFHHCRHYIGFAEGGQEGVKRRYKRHCSGDGSKLLRAVKSAGIVFKVVRTWEGDRSIERGLKNKKNSRFLCPVCNTKHKETH